MTITPPRTLLYVVIVALMSVVLCLAYATIASAAPAEPCNPADDAQCCACEPSNAAEPAPLPRLYLPAVLQRLPGMSAEFTPAQPVTTPEPDVELPLGDASQ